MNQFIISIFLFLFINSVTSAQSPTKVPANYFSLLRQANDKYKHSDYYDAIPEFENLLKLNSKDHQLHLKYGVCIVESGKDKNKALPHLKLASLYGLYEADFFIGKVFYINLQLDSAHFYWQAFKHRANQTEVKRFGVDRLLNHLYDALMLMNTPVDVEISNAGPNVNSTFADYSPLMPADGSMIIFTSRRNDTRGGKTDNNKSYFEDIYISKTIDDKWSPAENVGPPINSKEHDATVALSTDGNYLILYRTDPFMGSGDLFYSRKESKGWSLPVKLSVNINSQFEETSASLTPDGNTLYFSSNRPGGFGGLDIYKSTRKKNGVWSIPTNLGSPINTPYDEDCPFIHADERTLFFSSKGQEVNMGGYDIFKTYQLSNQKWAVPTNIGSPINTLLDDLFFGLSPDGKHGYLASNREKSLGDLDIYLLKLKQDTSSLTLFKGNVILENALTPLSINIVVRVAETNEEVAHYTSSPEDGKFQIILSNYKSYHITFDPNGNSQTEIIEPTNNKKYREIIKEVVQSQ